MKSISVLILVLACSRAESMPATSQARARRSIGAVIRLRAAAPRSFASSTVRRPKPVARAMASSAKLKAICEITVCMGAISGLVEHCSNWIPRK